MRIRIRPLWLVPTLVLALLAASGCDSDDDSDPTDTATGGDTTGGGDTGGEDTATAPDTTADTGGGEDTTEPARCELTPPAGTPTEIDFNTQILPILEGNGCTGCHGGSGGFFATELGTATVPEGNHGPVLERCDPAVSHIVQKVHPQCAVPFGSRMPLGGMLTEDEAWLIWQWVAEGAGGTFDAAACP